MLGGHSLNRSALNAVAGVVVISASAAWSAGASSVIGTPYTVFAARLPVIGTVHGIFSGANRIQARMELHGTATATIRSKTAHVGHAAWVSGVTLNAYLSNTVYAEVAFDATCHWYGISGAEFGSIAWTASATSITFESENQLPLTATWNTASSGVFSGGDIVRGAKAKWQSKCLARFEPHIATGGAQVYEAFGIWNSNLDWYLSAEETTVNITGAFVQGVSSLFVKATRIQRSRATWNMQGVINFPAKRVTGITMPLAADAAIVATAHGKKVGRSNMGITSLFSATASTKFAAKAVWQGVALLALSPKMLYLSRPRWASKATFTAYPVSVRQAKAEMVGRGNFTASGSRTAQSSIAWDGMGSWLAAAGVVTLVPAPTSRRFVVTGLDRKFNVGGNVRQYAA